MGIDVIKTYFTYGICAFVVIGGFGFLYAIRSTPEAANGSVALAIVGFIGMGLQFLFGQVVQSQTAHQTNVAATQLTGTNGHGSATTTTTVTPATTTTTVTPEEPKP